MIAKNIVHNAVLAGHCALFTTAADLLLDRYCSGKCDRIRSTLIVDSSWRR
jgi:hypothetical protein